ncbi:dipeptidase PepV [Lysinibacillus sp. 2017]|uniref:dipeptidase PepV n=1 Tax=unclassified Lysinibacillus TaxID=2636778 RepID=UPI000D529AD3|nr:MULTISPECIES: dipeptidase PepV [unclassified Lysinibacillus]AWE08377.1 dipeptidase PepV [Lysinibacillus sp. 2017]TGN35775.1 dipeptidase PepV [Lysinibacillus sp. S2017]
MNWLEIAEKRKSELLEELQQLIQIESVLDEQNTSPEMPFGPGPRAALDFMLAKGKAQGMRVKNVDNMAGHIEMGEGKELVGLLCHVDVVPTGDPATWTYPPFEGRVVDGKVIGRGAIDDKGPTIAAWLAMKMIKDEGIELNKRVRMIIGSDEESGFRCVDRYFEKEEMPSIGFAPDADFPLINAEKGIAHLVFSSAKPTGKEQLVSLKAGKRTNMVPEEAVAKLKFVETNINGNFQKFLLENNVEGSIIEAEEGHLITVKGKSAHAMEPEKGRNAAVYLAKFLQTVLTSGQDKQFVDFLVTVFEGDHYGSALKLNFEDEMSGPTTLNPGIITFDENGASIEVSMRYSVTYPFEEKITMAQAELQHHQVTLDVAGNSTPHYVSEEDDLIQTLLEVYRKYSGDFSKPLSTGGGTYARVMKKGVAFGMLFPGEPDVAHQADEFVVIENLVKAAAIYAEAIVKLASK